LFVGGSLSFVGDLGAFELEANKNLHCGWWGMGVYKDEIDNITQKYQ
jgi:hypothetical protein